jgi:hypothetical protein
MDKFDDTRAQQDGKKFIEAMLATGQYGVAQVAAVRSPVNGQMESVMCLIFSSTAEVAEVIAARVGEPTIAERAGLPMRPEESAGSGIFEYRSDAN